MIVLIACEESQAVCAAFRERGHEAYSCDIQECSGGHPEWHIQGDALKLINGNCSFYDAGGGYHEIHSEWDMLIAHPPCTYLTNCATRAFSLRCTPAEKVVKRWELRCEAAIFFMHFALARCERICIENPLGFMSHWRKPDQIIDPWMFAESIEDTDNYVTKRTCLWLKGLDRLKTNDLPRPVLPKRVRLDGKLHSIIWEERQYGADRAKARSKTFPGIARAMAEQWG